MIACFAGWQSTPGAQTAEGPSRRVLGVYWFDKDFEMNVRFQRGVQQALGADKGLRVEYLTEHLESRHEDWDEESEALSEYLRAKYAREKIDAVIVLSPMALDFVLRHRRDLFADAPIVSTTFRALSPEERGQMRNAVALTADGFMAQTLHVALELHPRTREVLVVTGSQGGADRRLEVDAREQLRGFENRVALRWLTDLPLETLIARIKGAGEGCLVLYVRDSRYTPSKDLDPYDMLRLVASSSEVPVYAPSGPMLGRGSVGGYAVDLEQAGASAAQTALRILRGVPVGSIAPVNLPLVPMFDWRQLQRWNIPEARLPTGSVVAFREVPFLERYRRYVVTGLFVVAAQFALIGGLLLQSVRRRRAEERASDTELRYQNVVETQSELICRFLPDTTLTFVNDAYCRFWSKSRHELLGTKFIDLIPPEVRAEVLTRIGRHRAGSDSHEHPVTLPDGTVGWHHWIRQAILDDQDRLIELQGVGRDVTDTKRAEEALRNLEARHSAILRSVPDLVFVVTRDGTYLDYQARDPSLLPVPPEAFLGKTISQIMPPALAERLMCALERVGHSQDPIIVEYELEIAGESRSFETRLVAAEDGRVLSIIRDITEMKRMLAENRDLVGRLIASQEVERQRIARELHDGLSQKIALLNIEIDQIAGQVSGASRTRLQQVSTRTSEIAVDVHNLSHELHPSKLQTLGLVAATQSLCRDVSRQSGFEVAFVHSHVPERIDPAVALCLYRIAQEALHNASRHSGAREVLVRLAGDANEIVLHIADSGVGFDALGARGSGLGLVSMRERVSLLKGQLVIHTRPGQGTRIGVRLPLMPTSEDSSAA